MNFLPAAVVAISVVLQLQTADALDRLCINANTAINKLFVDGIPYIDELKSPTDSAHCECIAIPVNSKLIAVEAKMNKLPGYIQECNPSRKAVYKQWVCKEFKVREFNELKGLKKKLRRWEWKDWFKRKRPNGKPWDSAREFNCGNNHCNNRYPSQPCYEKKCHWTQNAAANTIRCRLLQCAGACTDCSKAGPGKCNAGACVHGDGENELTGETSCQRRCHVEIKAFGKTSPTGDAYIEVKDLVSGSSEKWTVTKAGDYYATIDMSNCSITNRNYFDWSQAASGTQLYNKWNLAGSEFKKVIGIELGVGEAPAGAFSFAPWIFANSLGQGIATPAKWFPNEHYASYSADLQGVQNGDVMVTNYVMKK